MNSVTSGNKKTLSDSINWACPVSIRAGVEAFEKKKQQAAGDRAPLLGGDLGDKVVNQCFELVMSQLVNLRANDPAEFEHEVLVISRLMRPIHRVSPVKSGSVPA